MDIIVRATIMFWLLWIVLRASGKRELAEMTPFELILLMVLGDLVQPAINNHDPSITAAAIAILTIAMWGVSLSYAIFRWPFMRDRLDSTATVMVRDGVIDTKALKIERIAEEELLEEARQVGIHDVSDIELAVLESDGKMSFLRRIPPTSPTAQTNPESGPSPH